MHQRTNQPLCVFVEHVHEIFAALGAVDAFIYSQKYSLNLLIQFRAISDQYNPRILNMLANPLSQPDHDQTLAAALGVPDNSTFAPFYVLLRGANSEVLI